MALLLFNIVPDLNGLPQLQVVHRNGPKLLHGLLLHSFFGVHAFEGLLVYLDLDVDVLEELWLCARWQKRRFGDAGQLGRGLQIAIVDEGQFFE